MKDGFEIVDGHVHTFSSAEVSKKIIDSFNKAYNIVFANPGTGTIEDVLENMAASGVDYTIMANFAPPGILHKNNLWTIEASGLHKNLISLVSFHPDMEGSLWGFLEGYRNEGAKGVKLHPMAQGFNPLNVRLEEVYRGCGDIGFPIVFHCGRVANAHLNEYSDANILEEIIAGYPETVFILTHMADGNVEDVVRIAKSYPNVFFDTSIVITGYPPLIETNEPSWLENDQVVGVVNTIGADRVLFGSDYPWGSPGHDIDRIMGMKLTDEQKRLIFSENSIRIFKLDD